jgi:uncharacterized phage infection (PIP) family protein YhgE
MRTLSTCVSVSLATELRTELNTAVTAINDLTDRLEATDNLLGAVDDRLNEHLASAHGDGTHQLPNNAITTDAINSIQTALNARIDAASTRMEGINIALTARADITTAALTELTTTVDDLDRESQHIPGVYHNKPASRPASVRDLSRSCRGHRRVRKCRRRYRKCHRQRCLRSRRIR